MVVDAVAVAERASFAVPCAATKGRSGVALFCAQLAVSRIVSNTFNPQLEHSIPRLLGKIVLPCQQTHGDTLRGW